MIPDPDSVPIRRAGPGSAARLERREHRAVLTTHLPPVPALRTHTV
jgi:hypothetical protein